ncbi:MAG: mechanosensitive ion channel [Bacteroidales bacterium]|nr:mechanosensitive ion channel [Clostridium sp.]MCM1202551.1 mechanosensitive ion channel [Bacteroidales bacterium]
MVLEEINNQVVADAAKNAEESAGIVRDTLDDIFNWLIGKSGSVVVAVLFIAIGLKVVGFLIKLLRRSFERSKMEVSVAGFLLSIIRVLGYTLVFITAATIVGFEVTSFVTVLGTASLAVGLALQGALSNLAGGVLILLLKPFSLGDYIIENNKNNEGTVISIDIFYTRLLTYDNKVVVIPNGILADNSLVNLTNEEKRKIEVKIPIAYDSEMGRVKEIINKILSEEERILQEEPQNVFIDSFDESGMTLGIRAWVRTDDYWSTTWDLREKIKTAFDEQQIQIPYNRLEVEMLKGNPEKNG